MHFIRITLARVCALTFLIWVAAQPADAAEWRTVGAEDTVVKMIGWPDDLPCTFRDGGYNDSFSKKRTRIFCPNLPYHEGDRTYVIVDELQPGYFWGSGIEKDVRELWLFKRTRGYLQYFKDAKFEDGQEFVCRNNSTCGFRNVRFTVKGKPCQLAYYLPDLGNTDSSSGRSETPFSIAVLHCGTSVPFRRQHFELRPDRVTITYPDPTAARSGHSIPDRALCRMALNGAGLAWQDLGFEKYVAVAKRRGLSVSDCQKTLGISDRRDAAKKQAGGAKETPAGTGFAGCFDNPQNCR